MKLDVIQSYDDARRYYQQLRDSVYEEAANTLGGGVILRAVNLRTVQIANSWQDLEAEGYRPHRSTWSWVNAYPVFHKQPARFEISVWAGTELCGLCFGKPSRAKTKLGLNLVEATPVRPNPLGKPVFPVISYAATLYAYAIGADELCILDPVEGLINYYMQNGFSEPYGYHGTRIALKRVLK
jgi:hypothetical protein